MSSPMNKEQFLKQFDKIVTGIVDNKQRVRELSELRVKRITFPRNAKRFKPDTRDSL